MQVSQYIFQPDQGWKRSRGEAIDADLLLAFGSGKDCNGKILTDWWHEHFPNAELMGCSTAGEICDASVTSNTIVVTAIKFDTTTFKLCSVEFNEGDNSYEVGRKLATKLSHENPKLCFVLSDGLHVNGTQLVDGLNSDLPESTVITGGLAGDGKRFQETLVCANDQYSEYKVAALGLYGDNIDIQYGSLGGWDSFGPDRLITKSNKNQLLELDGRSALELYKEYLGDYAKDLPSSGLRFPLQVTTTSGKKFVRTLLAIDNESGAMTFAGDLPEGAYARLMRANYDRLVDGAQGAAELATAELTDTPDLAILISCVGRRIVLDQRIEEELEAAKEVLGAGTTIGGFYSYGEICPSADEVGCTLHNQTMTITTLRELS